MRSLRALCFVMVMAGAVLLGAPDRAAARTAQVTSGEHADFTRIVITFPTAVDWTMGRIDGGYGLEWGGSGFTFDLSQVYLKIPRTRLAAIYAEPASGNLNLEVGCRCHAIPFELRPGIIVVDIRDGPAPDGSAFETALQGAPLPALDKRPDPRPKIRPVGLARAASPVPLPTQDEWRSAVGEAARLPQPGFALPLVAESGPAALDQLRSALLDQIGRGATEGVVAIAKDLPEQQEAASPGDGASQARLGATASVGDDVGHRDPDKHTADGTVCLTDAQLDIDSWGEPTPVATTIGTILDGLVGEFDRPDPAAITRAVRYLIHIGFGQEALQILRSLEIAAPERALLETLAHIIEGDDVPGSVLAGMEVCDTAAALWAILALPHPVVGADPMTTAVIRTFSALPLGLRRHLGPDLAERFLVQGDLETARAIKDAIVRAPGEPGGAVRLMEARIVVANGDHDAGQKAITALLDHSGPTGVQASIALVMTKVDAGEPVAVDLITRLQADLFEGRGGENEDLLIKAIALALATQDQFAAAFAMQEEQSQEAPEIWRILAMSGSDSSLINHAVLPAGSNLPDVAPDIESRIAERLSGLGFYDAALNWLDPRRRTRSEADRLVIAAAYLQQRNPAAAIAILEGMETDDARKLYADALTMRNDPMAMTTYDEIDAAEQQLAFARRANDWQSVIALTPDDAWGAAAALILPTATGGPSDQQGPLSDGRAAVSESAASRQVLQALMDAVPSAATPSTTPAP